MKLHRFTNLINLRDKNRKLLQQVAELSWDEPFGMLTRPAFLQYCYQLPGKRRWVAFIDLDNIGSLNLSHGYTEVDRRVRTVFAGFHHRQDIVARWYSGDEIVILFSGANNPFATMVELLSEARKVELAFIFQIGVWDSNVDTIENAINELASLAGDRKNNLKMDYKEVPSGA